MGLFRAKTSLHISYYFKTSSGFLMANPSLLTIIKEIHTKQICFNHHHFFITFKEFVFLYYTDCNSRHQIFASPYLLGIKIFKKSWLLLSINCGNIK